MNFFYRIFQNIILLGAVQGLSVSSLLFFSKNPLNPAAILSKLIFLMALASFKLYGSMQAGSTILILPEC